MNSLKLILSNPAYFAPAWVFASLNIVTGTWVLYLPHIKVKFGLDDAQVGIALFCIALGILIAIPFVPLINKKMGEGQSTRLGIILFAIAFNLPFIASSYSILCAYLFLVGLLTGFTDVSMNALVATIENKNKKSFMSAAHGFFSLGGFIGAGIGIILISLLDNPSIHMALISIIVVGINLFISRHYQHVKDIKFIEKEEKRNYRSIRPFIGLSLVAFIIMISEGAVEHWSNLFLFDIVKVSESDAGLGFIAFSFCMTLGRLLGDGLSEKVGTIPLISYGCLLGAGACILIISAQYILAIIGFGIFGLGLSVIIPELYRLAGQTKGIPASVGISIVSGIGFTGFMIGPVLLGFISSLSSLVWSFGLLSTAILLAFVINTIILKRMYH